MLDPDTARKIIVDISCNTEPDDSKLTYTAEMLEFRDKVEEELEEARKDCPEIELHIPPELPDAE